MNALRLFVALAVAAVLVTSVTLAQIKVTGGDTGTFGGGASKIEPGMFGTPEFLIVLTPGKNGKMLVGGRIARGRGLVPITGNLTAANKILAKLQDKPQTPVDGRYNPNNDTVIITRIGSESLNEVLKRSSSIVKSVKYPIEPGQYSGRSTDPDGEWEIMVSKGPSEAFNVVGHVTINGKRTPIKAILRRDGTLAGYGEDDGQTVDGKYDFTSKKIDIKIRGGGLRASAILEPGRLPQVSVFGLVSKQVGKVPGPGEASDHKVSGSISEEKFDVAIVMKPPYQGEAKISFGFSNNMASTLKPGQIVELSVWGTSEKSGSYQPNLAGTGQWIVEGDGAQVLETSKAFAGTASNGTHYPSTSGKVKFRVLGQGTIKVTACYVGQFWGPAGDWNWNPCTYTYKFREPAKASVGGG